MTTSLHFCDLQTPQAGVGNASDTGVIHDQLVQSLPRRLDNQHGLVDVRTCLEPMERTRSESPVREVGDLRARSLRPIRHPDRDFFLADLLDYAIKDDAKSMEAPIFTLATKPDTSIWEWESRDGSKHVRVTPSVLGRATQFDKDVLIYVISQLTAALNENDKAQRSGKPVPRPDAKNRTIRFRVYDYLVVTNRGVSGRDYMDLRKALERLRGTTITTDIRTGRKLTMEAFGIIDRAKIVSASDQEGRMAAVEITISEWLFNAVGAYEVLTIHPDYFRLRKPLERRLYELARKHVGREKDQWSIGMVGLKNKTGSKATLREFRRMVKTIMLANTLPEFGMRVDERDIMTFIRKVPFYS